MWEVYRGGKGKIICDYDVGLFGVEESISNEITMGYYR